MAKAIGIDLGTTNTVVAEVQHGRAEPLTIQTSDSAPLIRSAVAYDKGTWIVGKGAEEVGRYAPGCVIDSTKRFIGLNYDDKRIQRDVRDLNEGSKPPRVVKPESGESGVRFRFYPEGEPYFDRSPIEVATLILKQVKKDAEGAIGTAITHAVITAPAYFDAARIEATRQAGEAAGLQVQRIISEPLAAALAYGIRLDASAAETVLVFDMGGGTLDVTVCAIGKNDCIELAKDGDNHLGGVDLDKRLEQIVRKRLREASGVDFLALDTADVGTLQLVQYDVRNSCRVAKERLSNVDEVTIPDSAWRRHPRFGVPGSGPVKVTRAEFEASFSDLVEQALVLTHQALDKAGCKSTDIDKVVLVGGSTYVPVIRERLRAVFGAEKVRVDVNPMEAVAHGAALLAATLPNLVLCPQCRTDQPADASTCQHCGAELSPHAAPVLPGYEGPHLQVVSTIARTMSVGTKQGNLVRLFMSGEQYSPTDGKSLAKAREIFRLSTTGSRDLRVEFYEGECQRIDDPECAFYADFVVHGLPSDTRQGDEVILEATLNGDGTLAGTMTFRGRVYNYVASPSKWRGDLVDTIEKARLILPNVSDVAARAQLQQAIDHAEDVVIEQTSHARAGQAAFQALSNAIDDVTTGASANSAEMDNLSVSLASAGAMIEYGGEWTDLMPMVTAPGLRETLLSESQLLNALRPIIMEGRQIQARNDTMSAERTTERIYSIIRASDLLWPLTLARIISEYRSSDSSRERGPGGLLSQGEWEYIRQMGKADTQRREATGDEGTMQQCAQDIGALLEQMQTTIVTNAALFDAQYQRVLQLMGQFVGARD